MNRFATFIVIAFLTAATLAGCGSKDPSRAGSAVNETPDELAVERAKLSAADRALVEAQEWCAVNTDGRLGSMGVPLKIDIKGQPVFLCCKGCKRKAESDPDGTLAKVEELKAKARSTKEVKN